MLEKLQSIFSTSYSPSLEHQLNITKHQSQIKNLLKKHPTPLYITDPYIIQDRYTQLKKALTKHWPHQHNIAYSFKTNYSLVKPIKKLGAAAEVVSGHEYQKALKHNFKVSKIILNGPHKPKSLLKLALKNNSLIHIDNFQEINSVTALTQPSSQQPKVGIRINLKPHKNQFGFNIQNKQAHQAINKLYSHSIPIQSLHLHQGSDIDKSSTYQEGALQLAKLANHIYQNFNTKVKYLDIGGGFPAHGFKPLHRNSWHPQPIQTYIKTITQALKQDLNPDLSPTLIVEPGRYLVADSTIFVCQVINKKQTKPQVLTANGAITMLPTLYYRPPITRLFTPKLQAKTSLPVPTTVYGSTCKSDDILLKKPLPPAKPNDLLLFYSTGAYNSNLTPNFIFTPPQTHILN